MQPSSSRHPFLIDLLDERELAFLKQAEEFCAAEVDLNVEKWEKEELLPREIFSKAGKIGLMGTTAPEIYGGAELRCVAHVLIVKELSYHFGAFGLDVAAHNTLCLGHILEFCSEDQRRRVAPKLASGEWLGAWALTEPAAGSDIGGLETTAVETPDGWEITGRKMFITQGRRADMLVVMARTGTVENGKKEISAFLVAKDQVEPVRKIPTFGVKASETSELAFKKSKAELIGEKGRGQEQALAVLDRGRIGVAAVSLGIATAALDAARHYALHRKQFGHKIADFEAIQWMVAESTMELEAAELLMLRAAAMQDRGLRTTKESAMAKLFASEAATRICNRAMQVHGGSGYSRDLPLERYLRDAKFCEIGEGTSEIQHLVIARNVFRETEEEEGQHER